MADGIVQVAPDSTGKKVDASELTVGANLVERQRVVLADGTVAAAIAVIGNVTPAGTEYGLLVRSVGSNIVAGPAAAGAAISGNPILNGGSDGTLVRALATDTTGKLNVNVAANAALVASTAMIGDSGVQYRANATGAATGAHVVSAATASATSVKAVAGRVVGWSFFNAATTPRFVKLHNVATAPTPGAGVVQTIGIPAGGAVNVSFDGGIAFTVGIGYTIVTGGADANVTAGAAADVVGDLFYA